MRLLWIDTDATLARKVGQHLAGRGFHLDFCADTSTALRRALAGSHDAIVLEAQLPRKRGFLLLREIRARGSAVPILMLASHATPRDRVRGLDLGADDYLRKPFEASELMARLRAISRRPRSYPSIVLTAHDLELDTVRQVARRAGRPIKLSTKEYAVLEYLLRNKGTVVTRAQVLEHAWDLNYAGAGSNLVEVYVNYLRDKLDRPFAPQLIHTVRGTGYVLRDPD